MKAMAEITDPTQTVEWREWRASGGPWLNWYRRAYLKSSSEAELNESELEAFTAWREERQRADA